MSNENTIHRFELKVVFEEDENSVISWLVEADAPIEATKDVSCEELTEAGAPLSALGIKVLRELLASQFIELALNKADNYRWRSLFHKISSERGDAAYDNPPDIRNIH